MEKKETLLYQLCRLYSLWSSIELPGFLKFFIHKDQQGLPFLNGRPCLAVFVFSSQNAGKRRTGLARNCSETGKPDRDGILEDMPLPQFSAL
ncbi:MAG: hypothetical protein OSJ58_00350 [Dysosmobacter sp.]|nr:hypothetical protein [Dysosmobacter sp.]